MDKKFIVEFALRNLLTRRLRTSLTILAMTVGISAIVFLVAFAIGLERLVTHEVTGGNAYQLIDIGTGNSQVVKLNKQALAQIAEIKSLNSIESEITAGAKAKKQDGEADATIVGASVKYQNWSGLSVRWGDFYQDPSAKTSDSGTVSANTSEAVINTAYLKFLGETDPAKELGKTITADIIIPKELSGQNEDKIAEKQTFVVRGVVQDDSSAKIYTSLESLTALGIVNNSQAKTELTRYQDASSARALIENMGFQTQYVGDTIEQINQVFNIFKIILASFGAIALMVAALGMFNTLTISLLERIKEIALMKILGMRKTDIRSIFLTESVIIGTVGGFFGIILGIALGSIANSILNHFAKLAGADQASVFYFAPLFIIGMIIFASLVGLSTGLYPARRATKVNALDVLRYE